MGMKPPELTEGMKAALAITALGLADPLPIEEAIQCGAVLAIALAKFCDPVRCQYDAEYAQTFPVALPRSWPTATKATSRNVVKGDVPQHVIDALDSAMQHHARLNSCAAAMLKTVFRRYSAKRDKARDAERLQQQYQKRLCKELSKESKDSVAAWKQFLQKRIWEVGFPALETTLLQEWHLTDFDIHWLRVVSGIIPPPSRPMTVTDMVQALIKMTDQYEFCDCSCEG
jgi:hypothetical protein